MNRAWIPAGALAGVSVAGLIALGPLTDSLGTTVKFNTSVPVMTEAGKAANSSVPVSVNVRVVGKTQTAALPSRGGRASTAPSNTDSGFVSINKRAATPPPSTASNTPVVADAPAKPAVEPKKQKQPKRQQSIGTSGETNGDQGFAGGSSSGSTGEGSVTPSPAGT